MHSLVLIDIITVKNSLKTSERHSRNTVKNIRSYKKAMRRYEKHRPVAPCAGTVAVVAVPASALLIELALVSRGGRAVALRAQATVQAWVWIFRN